MGAETNRAVPIRMSVPTRLKKMPPSAPTKRICSVRNRQLTQGRPRKRIAATIKPNTPQATTAQSPVRARKVQSSVLRMVLLSQETEGDRSDRPNHEEQQQPETDHCRPVQRIAIGDV